MTYFHASTREFDDGAELLPPTQTGVTPNCPDAGRPLGRVYAASSHAEAEEWAGIVSTSGVTGPGQEFPEVYIYEVELNGRIHTAHLHDVDLTEHHAPRGRVVRLAGRGQAGRIAWLDH